MSEAEKVIGLDHDEVAAAAAVDVADSVECIGRKDNQIDCRSKSESILAWQLLVMSPWLLQQAGAAVPTTGIDSFLFVAAVALSVAEVAAAVVAVWH